MTTKIFADGTSISFSDPTTSSIAPDTGLSAVSTIIDVTTGVAYSSVTAAISGSNAGDLIEIPAGTYTEDFPNITHGLTLEGVGGLAHLEAPGNSPKNLKAILVTDADVTLDGIELSGAVVPDGNGAGVRMEAGTLDISNSYIHDNQDGILTVSQAGLALYIDHSWFDHNGSATGPASTHNLYVGSISTLEITNSLFTNAVAGHEVKTGAASNTFVNDRLLDESGSASYGIDDYNGTDLDVENTVIQKSPNSGAGAAIHFGSNNTINSSLTVKDSVYIDDKATTPFILDQAVTSGGSLVVPSVTGTTFYGLPNMQVADGVPVNYGPPINTFDPNVNDAPPLDTSAPFAIACYREGTLIDTERGPLAIEALREGDRVASAFGGSAPVIWIGCGERIDCRRHPYPEAVLPVRVSANAFGEGLPRRDLWLSPEHGVYVDGVLIPIGTLLNGRSIRQEAVAFVRYLHVELPAHDVILAEGLPAESYLDTGYRGAFANGGPMRKVPADYAQRVWEAEGCAPHITHGPIHARVFERVRERAGRGEAVRG